MEFKRERPWKFVLLALLPIILIAGLFLWSVRYTFLFKSFKAEFAASVSYAQENDCLRAVSGGETTRLTVRNANSVFTEVTNGGFSKYEKDAPEGESIFLNFGNNATMRIWDCGDGGLIVHYTNSDTDMLYRTSEAARFINVQRIISTQWGNPVWDDSE